MSEFINQMEPTYGQEEISAITEYMKSGGWLMEFSKTREFEKMICGYTGAKFCSVVTNGTLSLFIGLVALGIKEGDEVILPNYTMIASPNAIKLTGAKPIFVDIDEDSLCINPDEVEKLITPRTKAVMHVSINGRAGRIDLLKQLCKERNIYLVEDAAQSLGSFHNGKHVGTIGKWGSFSFSVPKIITTGQGGALITNDLNIYNKFLKIKDFGRIKGGVDVHDDLGWNFKFTDIQSVIGIEQMKKLPNRVIRKKEIYNLYLKLINSKKVKVFNNPTETAPWFIEVLTDYPEKLQDYLKTNNIGTRLFYPSINTQLIYKKSGSKFPISKRLMKNGLWLPSSLNLTNKQIEYICSVINQY